MALQHFLGLVEEDARLVRRRLAPCALGLLGADEDLALGQEEADECRERGEASRTPEERAPGRRRLRHERQVNDGGEQIADGIALLEDARREATDLDGQVFERSGCCETPDTTHRNTEEGAEGEELLESLDKARAELKDGDQDQVGDEWPFATVPVRDDTEDDLYRAQHAISSEHVCGGVFNEWVTHCSDRAEEKCECDGGRLDRLVYG